MFKIIILSQIGADRYQKLIFEILLLSPPPLENCAVAGLGCNDETPSWQMSMTKEF